MPIIKTSSTPSGNRKRDSTRSKTFFAPASELQPFGTATHHEFGLKGQTCPLVLPLGVSPIGLNLIGMPQTTGVGYTFPPVTLGFQNGQNKPSWSMVKKCVYFFNSPRNTHVTSGETSRWTSTFPHPGPGIKVKGERRSRNKIDVSVVRMRPRELCLPQGWAFRFVFIHKGLRVRVRVRGLGLLGPTPRLIHDVTFSITSSPPCHHPHHDVILPMMSHFPGGEGFQGRLIFDWLVMWPIAARWLVHLYHVTYIWLSDWSVPKLRPYYLHSKHNFEMLSIPVSTLLSKRFV